MSQKRTIYRFGLTAIMLVLAMSGFAWAQTPSATSSVAVNDLDRSWREIQMLKSNGQDIPSSLYDRYFELERQVYPDRYSETGALQGHLDQALDACPGLIFTQPDTGHFSFVDYGQTYTSRDDCRQCRSGRDVVYQMVLVRPQWLQISTCGSGFDTYLCIYKDSCCTPGRIPFAFNDDNTTICGAHSLKAAINMCFIDPGTYYIVLDGYNFAAAGHYAFSVTSIEDSVCGFTPEVVCPFPTLADVANEAPCDPSTAVTCPGGYCGIIDQLGDLDVVNFTLPECAVVTLSVYANDTPGRSGTGHGLNPQLTLFTGSCDHPIAENDDYNGTLPGQPVLHDSRIVTECLRGHAEYWCQISGVASVGPYEFTIDCQPCPPIAPLTDVTVTHPTLTQTCVNWPAGTGPFYVWRLLPGPGQVWVNRGSRPASPYCETTIAGATYQVFNTPCASPAATR
jgi:hypothetical protein